MEYRTIFYGVKHKGVFIKVIHASDSRGIKRKLLEESSLIRGRRDKDGEYFLVENDVVADEKEQLKIWKKILAGEEGVIVEKWNYKGLIEKEIARIENNERFKEEERKKEKRKETRVRKSDSKDSQDEWRDELRKNKERSIRDEGFEIK